MAAIDLVEQADPTAVPAGLKQSYLQFRPALDGYVVPPERTQETPPLGPGDLAAYENATAADAIGEIVKRAKRTRVVIVNEAHDSPRDRAFILELAQALRPLGYNVYAAETFTRWGPQERARLQQLVKDGYPRFSTGIYSVEPMFGYLIREVLRLGYRPLAYEWMSPEGPIDPVKSIPVREQAQADNLARAIAADPTGKLLVHVGYHHVAERPIGPSGAKQEWMAARLARLTGVDPLTVDQTGLTEFLTDQRARAIYRALSPRVGALPKVFLKNRASLGFGETGEATDLQVIHPRIATIGGRPDWLRKTGRRPIPIPSALLPRTGRRLVQTFVTGEASDAVPIDQVLVTAGAEPPVVYAPSNVTIRWAVQDE